MIATVVSAKTFPSLHLQCGFCRVEGRHFKKVGSDDEKVAYQRSSVLRVFLCVATLPLSLPPSSAIPFHIFLPSHSLHMSNESFFAWIHVWLADKAAGTVEQSRQICLFTPRQCGTTAMTTGAGLDIYLAC